MTIQLYNFVQKDLENIFNKINPEELAGLKNQSVCITGGSGFIGTWLCNMIQYLNEQHQFQTKVFVMDRSFENIQKQSPHLLNAKLFEFKKLDTRTLVDLPKDINYIIHTAGTPDTRGPIDVITSIAQGTENLLKTTQRLSNLKMFLNLSSSLVYGSFYDKNKKIQESNPTGSTSNLYAVSKLYSEAICDAYRQEQRLPVTTLRPFSFIGPFQSLSSPWVFNNFISDAINGHSIKVLGDGSTTRSFLYASDASFWILKTLITAESGSKYNLGSPQEITLKELSTKVHGLIGTNKETVYNTRGGATDRTSYMVPDTEEIQKNIKVQVTMSLDESIKRTIEWYTLSKNNL
jgi:dTDP-glucose 4,6-dehydratase